VGPEGLLRCPEGPEGMAIVVAVTRPQARQELPRGAVAVVPALQVAIQVEVTAGAQVRREKWF
jgi:enamine deaminase RidA (YjgF/YER057c/UK114 family)